MSQEARQPLEVVARSIAVKRFFEEGSDREVSGIEMMHFWKACTAEEREEFGKAAAQHLGVELQPV